VSYDYGTPVPSQQKSFRKTKTSFTETPSSGQIWKYMLKFTFLAPKRGNFFQKIARQTNRFFLSIGGSKDNETL
jgi:hypothetical protein